MKMYLLSALAFCLLPSLALATDYYPTKDVALNGTGGENYNNGGAAPFARAAKYRQHSVLMDFDWNAIANEIVNDGRPLQSVQLRLSEAFNSLEGTDFGIMSSYIDDINSTGDKDWDEGDGAVAGSTNFNWTADTWAAVSTVPSLKNDGQLTDDGDLWMWGSNKDFESFWNFRNNAASLANTASFVWPTDGVDTTLFIDLDIAIIEQQSGIDIDGGGAMPPPAGAKPVGIYTYKNVSNNGRMYLREEPGLDKDPMIRVTFADAVPEPTSLGLLLVGSLGLLLHKRRS